MRISDWSSDVCSSDLEEKYAPKKKVTGHAKEFADSLYGAYTKANSTGTDLATKAPIRIRSFRKRSLFRRVFTQSQPSGVFGMPRMLRQRLVHSNVVDRKSTRLNSSH